MQKMARHFAAAIALTSLAAWADSIPTDPTKALQLAGQKSKLVEMLINTPAMKAASDNKDPNISALVLNSRMLFNQAQSAISDSHGEEALTKLDEAIRGLSKASSMLTNDESSSINAKKKQFEEHASQIDSYRRSINDLTASPRTASGARQLIARLEVMTSEGKKLFDSGKLEEANKHMAAAYKFAVEEIARLRDGQEVVMHLHFNSPREEFIYEQKRYYSNEILVGLLLREDRASVEAKKQVDIYVNMAIELKEGAASKASANDYPTAIKEMEKANQHLNRALQMMGVPVF